MLNPKLSRALIRRSPFSIHPPSLLPLTHHHPFSHTAPSPAPASHPPTTIPFQVHGTGTGTYQTISVPSKPYTFAVDTYTTMGGHDSAPSPVAYSLGSLSGCIQVTGSTVARDHGIKLGRWDVAVTGELPTAVLVRGEEGNANFEGVRVVVRVQTDVDVKGEKGRFERFAGEVERRCPVTQLFKRSGVRFGSEWVGERL